MFSRSATTITPSRISHSSGRSEALWMRKVVRPAGTVSSAGSQVASVTVTAISPGTGSGRLLRAASQKAASPAATRRPAPARARLVVRRETGRGVAAMAQVPCRAVCAAGCGRRKKKSDTPSTSAQTMTSPRTGAS